MAAEERRAWTMLVVTVVAYLVYLGVVLGPSAGTALAETPYRAALLWTVGGAIAASILLHVLVTAFSPDCENTKDQRDREIHRFGEYVGQSFVVVGAVAGLVLAMAGAAPFWIANAIYLAFVLSAVLSSVAKIVAYRFGFHPW
ncbi:hypothetical protein [Streptomyces xanthophaeus]|uniref:hypothetical protein n=1 Tax=Streptomyces xanthophaeus TaxID=67385 RepID=UPI00366215F1